MRATVRGVVVTAVLLGALLGAAPALAQEPPPPVIADGVTIQGVEVGGMTRAEAVAAVQDFARRPFVLTFRRHTWQATAWQVGSESHVRAAVLTALAATTAIDVHLPVTVDLARLRRYVHGLETRFSKPARDSRVYLHDLHPRVTKARKGFDVIQWETRMALRRTIRAHKRGPKAVQYRILRPRINRTNFGPVIVIRRGSHRLYLYGGVWMGFRASFGVAVGQPIYPTPLGKFTIVTMQRNPWWYPPATAWAAGASPIPPGPGNPLGTRWMGLSAGGVGIHGTPDAASIGYSASHGCIRMRIPEAEWLFERVRVGTTVFIVSA
jgi:lipoprotein-anchoring transpeptidase ErfK/SrfK